MPLLYQLTRSGSIDPSKYKHRKLLKTGASHLQGSKDLVIFLAFVAENFAVQLNINKRWLDERFSQNIVFSLKKVSRYVLALSL